MNYFAYKPNAQMGKVWGLFSQLGCLSEEEIISTGRHDYSHTMDIVKSAIAGNISLEDENILSFNLKGYEYACKANDKIAAIQNTEKELFIVDSVDSDEENERVNFGDISERKLKRLTDEFDEMLDETDFERNITVLCNLRNEYIIEKGVDLVELLHSALSGISNASEILVGMVKRDAKLSEVVSNLCDVCNQGNLLTRLELCLGGI